MLVGLGSGFPTPTAPGLAAGEWGDGMKSPVNPPSPPGLTG
jgi:hypothetical protein